MSKIFLILFLLLVSGFGAVHAETEAALGAFFFFPVDALNCLGNRANPTFQPSENLRICGKAGTDSGSGAQDFQIGAPVTDAWFSTDRIVKGGTVSFHFTLSMELFECGKQLAEPKTFSAMVGATRRTVTDTLEFTVACPIVDPTPTPAPVQNPALWLPVIGK